MAIDASIPLQGKQPDFMNNISQMTDIARNTLAYKQAQALYQPTINQGIAQSQSAQEAAQQAHLATIRGQVANAAQDILSLHGTGISPEDLRTHITEKMTNAGAQPDAIQKMIADVPTDPKQIDSFLVKKAQSVLTLPEQMASKFPAPTMINTGQEIQPTAPGNQALTGVQPGTVQGLPTQIQPPPTTNIMENGVPKMLGAMTPQQKSVGGAGIQVAPALGQTITAETAPKIASNDWIDTNTKATSAPTTIGIMQNMKILAKKAITGSQADKLAAANGMLSLLPEWAGGAKFTDLQTATNELNKEANMAALSSQLGSTDAAHNMISAALPGVHVTPEATNYAADQAIGQEKLKQIKQQHFGQFAKNPDAYVSELQNFSKIDPRAVQFSQMSPEEKALVKKENAKDPKVDANFRNSLIFLRSHGYTQ